MEVLKRPEALKTKIKRSRSIIEREETNLEGNHNTQIVIHGDSFKNNILSYAWNAYFDKNKIKKNIMVCCDLNKICDEILRGVENNILTLKTFSFLLIGVCSIYKKKVYFIGQDYDFLKRKILSLYKNKDENVNELINNKDSKKKKGGKDDDDQQNKNKKRLNRTSLNIKRGSIDMNELFPSVINDFGKRKSRFSLNADEISISGTQQNTYNDFFNENEMNNQMFMDISGLNQLSFNDHDIEKPLEGSYVSRNSIPVNNFEGLNLNRGLSDSFNHMDNMNAQNSILNNMIPKNMFSNLENSFSEKSMNEYNNNLELNSVHRSDIYTPSNLYNNLENNNINNNTNVNDINYPDYKIDNANIFSNINDQGNANVYGNIINNNQNMNNNLNSMGTPKHFPNLHYMSSGNNFMGNFNNMNNVVNNNRNDLYNLNPFMNMNSMNNNVDPRNSFHFSQRINNFGDVDATNNLVGSMFSPQKKKNMSKKIDYSNILNFESYQNFDYFDQKDDDAFIKKLNSLLGLDENEGDKENANKIDSAENTKDDDVNNANKLLIQDKENSKNSLNSNNNDDKNNQIILNEENDKNGQIVVRGNENQIVKKRKLEKHIIDKNYIVKDSVIKGMMKDESVDYKYFLIDAINNEINEKIQKEYPAFQYFSLQTSDKIKPVNKLEINFGYESSDHDKKKMVFENYLDYLVNNKLSLYENKNVLENFNIKKCLDNIDEHMIHNENDDLSNKFLSFKENDETMKSDINFEEVREEFGDIQFETNNMNTNDYKNRFSIDPMLSQNEQVDLNLSDLSFRDCADSSKINLESQMLKSLVPTNRESSIDKNNDINNLNFVNDKINSEFNSSPLDLSVSSNYDFSNIFSKENDSSINSILEDKNLEININLNQDFDLITKELLETYQNLSKKINYIFFDIITKNRKSKSEVSILFYITLHLANLGYIHIIQKPIIHEHLEYYEENLSRPILIQFVDQKKNN